MTNIQKKSEKKCISGAKKLEKKSSILKKYTESEYNTAIAELQSEAK